MKGAKTAKNKLGKELSVRKLGENEEIWLYIGKNEV